MKEYAALVDEIVFGDNLEVMRDIESGIIDLCYIDPPFFTQKEQKTSKASFDDTWPSIDDYLNWMKERVIEIYRLLKSSGSFYLHCDWHAENYLGVLCDGIFGYNNCRNHIVWKRYASVKNVSSKMFPVQTDSIFFYTKSSTFTFHKQFQPFDSDYTKHEYRHVDRDGQYALLRGRKYQQTGQPKKKYLQDAHGSPVSSLWDEDGMTLKFKNQYSDTENLDYPTQKPQSLLERIIKTSSNAGDVVLDPCCGSGTTLVAAKLLDRHYIGIDNKQEAISFANRMVSSTKISKVYLQQLSSKQMALF